MYFVKENLLHISSLNSGAVNLLKHIKDTIFCNDKSNYRKKLHCLIVCITRSFKKKNHSFNSAMLLSNNCI